MILFFSTCHRVNAGGTVSHVFLSRKRPTANSNLFFRKVVGKEGNNLGKEGNNLGKEGNNLGKEGNDLGKRAIT